MFEMDDGTQGSHPTAEWMALRSNEVANIRAAIDWAFKSAQQVNVGVALTMRSERRIVFVKATKSIVRGRA